MIDIIPAIAEDSTRELAAEDLWQRIGRQLTWHEIDNADVAAARRHYLRQSTLFPVLAERGSLYLPYIVDEVERRGLPLELALLPVVESMFDPFAYSSGGAAGLWQIMPATGRYLGLEQNWWYDGRRDVRESTTIALDYLERLHKQFDDDWLLALAAYNAGNGRIGRAQRINRQNGLETDFWSLQLPRETRRYVPKLIALSQIIAAPQRYGVVIPTIANEPAFEVCTTGGQIELARAASMAGLDVELLHKLNPGHLRWATSPNQAHELLLPPGQAEQFTRQIAGLSEEDRVQWAHYQIRPGDSLIRIAKKFDTQVALLREVNHIRGSRIRAGDTLMIPRGHSWSSSLAMAGSEESSPTGYRVRRGDSLYRIANRFNVSVQDILAWNSLDRDRYLQPGQKLTLYVRGG